MRVLFIYDRGAYKTDLEAVRYAAEAVLSGKWLTRVVDGGRHVPDNNHLVSCYIPDPDSGKENDDAKLGAP
jgi:hypothetical protein